MPFKKSDKLKDKHKREGVKVLREFQSLVMYEVGNWNNLSGW